MKVTKGQKADITKNRPDIKKLAVNLSWQVKDGGNPSHYEIDAAAFLLTMNGKTRDDQDFVFYNNPAGGSGAVRHALFCYPDIGITELIPQNAASRLILTNPHIKPPFHKNGGIIFIGLTHITA